MTAETLRDALVLRFACNGPEKCPKGEHSDMCEGWMDECREAADALIAAARAEEAAKRPTVEVLAKALHRVGIESSNWYCGRADHQREHGVEPGDADWAARDEDKHRIESERLFAALNIDCPFHVPRTAVRAEEAAKGLTVERLAEAIMEVDGQTDEYLTKFQAIREANLEYAAALLAALTPTPPPPAGCERTHWDGSTLLAERNHYLAGCSCPQRPWCVPHGWAGVEPEHHAICADHEHVATPPPPAATVERCAVVYPFGPACPWTEPDHRWLAHPFAPAPEPK